MFPLIENTASEFVTRVEDLLTQPKNGLNTNGAQKADGQSNGVDTNPSVVDSEKLVGGYTADAIVPCAFGLKSGVMYNEEDPFAVALHAFYEMSVYNIFEK